MSASGGLVALLLGLGEPHLQLHWIERADVVDAPPVGHAPASVEQKGGGGVQESMRHPKTLPEQSTS